MLTCRKTAFDFRHPDPSLLVNLGFCHLGRYTEIAPALAGVPDRHCISCQRYREVADHPGQANLLRKVISLPAGMIGFIDPSHLAQKVGQVE
jgi:hypothetical protein